MYYPASQSGMERRQFVYEPSEAHLQPITQPRLVIEEFGVKSPSTCMTSDCPLSGSLILGEETLVVSIIDILWVIEDYQAWGKDLDTDLKLV